MNKNLCVIQARMSSTRLPGKVLKEINRKPLLQYEIERLRLAKKLDQIVVATSASKESDEIEKFCERIGVPCFRGSEEDVLNRYYECAKKYPGYDAIVRVTGDCPLIDPRVVDEVVNLFEEGGYDYASNVLEETFPDGMDVEVLKRDALKTSQQEAKMQSEREHVTLYVRGQEKFKKGNLCAPRDYSAFRLTVDNPEDFAVAKFLIESLPPTMSYLDCVELLAAHPEIKKLNMNIKRNEGLAKSLKEDRLFKSTYSQPHPHPLRFRRGRKGEVRDKK